MLLSNSDNGDLIINVESDVREVNLAGQIVRQVTLGQLNNSLAAAGYSLALIGSALMRGADPQTLAAALLGAGRAAAAARRGP